MRKNKNIQNNSFSILTVDDDPIMTSAIEAYFKRRGFTVDAENDPKNAVEKVKNNSFDILLLDYLMSPLTGDQVVSRIRKFNKDIFIILLTGHKSMAPPIKSIRELDIQGYYEKSDRFDQLEMLVELCLKSIRQIREIKSYQQMIERNYLETITALRTAVDAKDSDTGGHSERVSVISAQLARAMGLPESEAETIGLAGLFHDLGKIGVPDRILTKPEKLTAEEYDMIKEHPSAGARILSGISRFKNITPIVESHHERPDGKGYPSGLNGDEIPLGARIVAVADMFDAMVSKRIYKDPECFKVTIDEIQRVKGTQIDTYVADTFLNLIRSDENSDIIFNMYKVSKER